jgi:hypothetical protein
MSYGTNGVVTIQNNAHDGMEVTTAGDALLTDVSDSTTQNPFIACIINVMGNV